jgi:putative heme-binding domain-containing protein
MKRPHVVMLLFLLMEPSTTWAQNKPPELVASTDPRTPEEERLGFHLPDGFTIRLIAAEPDIHKPMNIAFDDRGRLWVTETIEYPFPAPNGRKPRDAVKVLEDFDEDGRARKVTTFADGLNIPIGLLPMPGGRSALVHSIPSVLRLEDTDGDGQADARAEIYATFGSKDTHGMTNSFSWGPDGWVYATHGFSNESSVKGSDDRAITMQSGNTYRMRKDGSHLEYFTHGQVNPFGLCFDALGNLYSADCHTKPMYQLLRGAWYPSFGKPHDGLGFGPEMVQHDHGSTAIAGIVYYTADAFPEDYRDALYVGNVVTNRINFDRLERHGSTYKGIAQPDFLTSDDPWFRPVDLKLGPDGALYVADFYNRIIGHYEVPLDHPGRDRERGRIWRISADKATPCPDVSDGAPTEILIAALDHPNLVVRTFATNQLERRGATTISPLRELLGGGASPRQWTHALWALERASPEGAGPFLMKAAAHDDPLVRVHAQRVLAERAEWADDLRRLAISGLADADAFVQRAAADALGQHPQSAQVRPLLALRLTSPEDDTHLRHVVRMALRDHFTDGPVWSEYSRDKLDEAQARVLADIMPGVPRPEAAGFLVEHLRRTTEAPDVRVVYVRHAARYGKAADRAALLALVRDEKVRPLPLIKAMLEGTRERGDRPEEALTELALERCRAALEGTDPDGLTLAIEQVSAFKLSALAGEVRSLATRTNASENVRLAAFEALVALDTESAVPILGAALTDPSTPVPLREKVAQILARLNRTDARGALLAALPLASARLQAAIATGLVQSGEGSRALLDAIEAGKASARLLTDRGVEVKLRQAGAADLDERINLLTAGLPRAEEQIQRRIDGRRASFEKARGAARPEIGATVYEKQCSACHVLGGKGGRVGPQLDGVGLRGPDRLIEDIVDPNRNVDQAFRATTLALADGQILSGLLLREEGQVLVLADAQGKEVRVGRDQVEESRVVQASPMPANLADQIAEDDFHHLLAFLLAQVPADEGR